METSEVVGNVDDVAARVVDVTKPALVVVRSSVVTVGVNADPLGPSSDDNSVDDLDVVDAPGETLLEECGLVWVVVMKDFGMGTTTVLVMLYEW